MLRYIIKWIREWKSLHLFNILYVQHITYVCIQMITSIRLYVQYIVCCCFFYASRAFRSIIITPSYIIHMCVVRQTNGCVRTGWIFSVYCAQANISNRKHMQSHHIWVEWTRTEYLRDKGVLCLCMFVCMRCIILEKDIFLVRNRVVLSMYVQYTYTNSQWYGKRMRLNRTEFKSDVCMYSNIFKGTQLRIRIVCYLFIYICECMEWKQLSIDFLYSLFILLCDTRD